MQGPSRFWLLVTTLTLAIPGGALASDSVQVEDSCPNSPGQRCVRDVLDGREDDALSLLQRVAAPPAVRPSKEALLNTATESMFSPVHLQEPYDKISRSPYDEDNVLSNPMNEELIDQWFGVDLIMLTVFGCVLLGVDAAMLYFQKRPTISGHLKMLGMMFIFSCLYGIGVLYTHDWQYATAWTTGYIVEWALSMDNLFVFHMIFTSFAVPDVQAEFALTVGIYGAMLLRIAFIMGLEEIFKVGYVVDVVVGIVLIISGMLTLTDDDDDDVEDLYTVRFFKWACAGRLQSSYDSKGRLFVTGPNGERRITILFLVVCIVSVADVFFAVDSMGSKTGQIKSAYVNLSSSLMAMFSLRAAFFVIRDLSKYFELMKYGIASILIFVGLEMMASKWVNLSLGVVCLVITFFFVGSLIASIISAKCFPSGEDMDDEEYAPEISSDTICYPAKEKKKKLVTQEEDSKKALADASPNALAALHAALAPKHEAVAREEKPQRKDQSGACKEASSNTVPATFRLDADDDQPADVVKAAA
mmetsp:Transcript_117098/g.203264  ORF Transcript_117098/g.203264 Transcript_117098/m.203264 type:complete len:530 (+) Transcript_117098:40-1629(+)